MKNIKMNDIKNITLTDAQELYAAFNISFIIRDGKIKGISIK